MHVCFTVVLICITCPAITVGTVILRHACMSDVLITLGLLAGGEAQRNLGGDASGLRHGRGGHLAACRATVFDPLTMLSM